MSLWIWLILATLFVIGLGVIVRSESKASRRNEAAANPLTAKRRWQ